MSFIFSSIFSSFQEVAKLFQTSSFVSNKDSAESIPKRDKPLRIKGNILVSKESPPTIPQHAMAALCDVEQIRFDKIFPPTASIPPA